MSLPDHSGGDVTLAELIADAACVHLPMPRTARASHVIDLTIPAPRTIEIPSAGISLVEGYSYGV